MRAPCHLRSIAFILVLLVLKSNSQGQATGDSREDFLYGEHYLEERQYSKALPFYLSALKDNSENSNINYRIGECYINILGEQNKALPYFQKAVNEINQNYIAGKYKNSGAPIEAWLFLGDAYLLNNQLTDASYAYHTYLGYVEGKDKKKEQTIINKIAGLGVIHEIGQEDKKIHIINMGSTINSRFSDYNPVLTSDQSMIIYTQFWESYDMIMYSQRKSGQWIEPRSLNEEIGSDGNCYSAAISSDGKTLYLIKINKDDYDIYYSEFQENRWSEMKPLRGKVNSKNRESSMCISYDGNQLYFSSDRSGGMGGFDIYSAELRGNEWVNITNVGKPINTEGNEEAPFITYDGKFLFFSSDGHESLGFKDIIVCEKNHDSTWSEPKNLGAPINTTSNDIFLTYFDNTKTAYISKDLPDGYGRNDIYILQESVIPPKLLTNRSIGISDTVENTDLVKDTALNYISEYESVHPDYNNSNIAQTVIVSDSIRDDEHQFMLNEEATVEYDNKQKPNDSIKVYTIQIMALKKPVKAERFNLSPLTVSSGMDGFTRYAYGEYPSISEALLVLPDIKNMGFHDAFIINVNLVQNYKNDNTVDGTK